METVTVPILESDLQKLEEIADAIRLKHGFEISPHNAAFAALFEGIDKLHKSWVTDK